MKYLIQIRDPQRFIEEHENTYGYPYVALDVVAEPQADKDPYSNRMTLEEVELDIDAIYVDLLKTRHVWLAEKIAAEEAEIDAKIDALDAMKKEYKEAKKK